MLLLYMSNKPRKYNKKNNKKKNLGINLDSITIEELAIKTM